MAASQARGVEMLSNPVTCTSCHNRPIRSASSTLTTRPSVNTLSPSWIPPAVNFLAPSSSRTSSYSAIGPESSFGNMEI